MVASSGQEWKRTRIWTKTWKNRLVRFETTLLRERRALRRTRTRLMLRLGTMLGGEIWWEDGVRAGLDLRLYPPRLLGPCRSPRPKHRRLQAACPLRACFRLPKSIEPIDPPLEVVQEAGASQERLIVLRSSKGSGRRSPFAKSLAVRAPGFNKTWF